MGQIFVAFSEYLNFKNMFKKLTLPCWWSLRGHASPTRWGWCRGFRAWSSSWRWCTRACSFRIRPKRGPCSLHLQSPWIKLVGKIRHNFCRNQEKHSQENFLRNWALSNFLLKFYKSKSESWVVLGQIWFGPVWQFSVHEFLVLLRI